MILTQGHYCNFNVTVDLQGIFLSGSHYSYFIFATNVPCDKKVCHDLESRSQLYLSRSHGIFVFWPYISHAFFISFHICQKRCFLKMMRYDLDLRSQLLGQ